MSKILVIPDIHLKPDIVREAKNIFDTGKYDYAVFLGDIADDWGCERQLDFYHETFAAVYDFLSSYKNRTLFCYGNHDISYVWRKEETGYSVLAEDVVTRWIQKMREGLPNGTLAFIHRIDNILFSHAGITDDFVVRICHLNIKNPAGVIDKTNSFAEKELWRDNSPIWARPGDGYRIYSPPGLFQVAGHTPVKTPFIYDNCLYLDTFSTYSNGDPIGDRRFVYIDSETHEWDYV